MISWNDIKHLELGDLDVTKIDLSKFDVTKIDLGRLDIRNLDLPTFDLPELPKFDMPKFDLPKLPDVELPKFDLPKLPDVELPADLERVAGFARDAAYAGVGAVVVTAQQLDERRRDLTDQVAGRIRKVVDAVA